MAGREGLPGSAPAMPKPDEGFLGRWSRRKAEAKTAEDRAASLSTTEDLANADAPDAVLPSTEADEPPAFDVASLPDIDALGPGSDFSMFMQAGVPPALKTKALRKLWRVKPELANLDGLLDYGEDLTGSFKVVDHLKTVYEVGRGFLRDKVEDAPPTDAENDKDIASDRIQGDSDASDPKKIADLERHAGPERDVEQADEAGTALDDDQPKIGIEKP